VRTDKRILQGDHGLAIFNHENQLIWAWAKTGFSLEPGESAFLHRLQSFPVRPGLYSLYVSLYDDGEQVDAFTCVPDLIVATEVYQYPFDDWKSVLNLPCEFEIKRLAEK
jgi:hypothetical protein